jgi:hypothetical protein
MCESDPRRVRPFLTSLGCAAPLDPLVASHPRPLRTAGSTAGSDRSRPGARAGTGCSLDLHADPGGLAGGKRACERGDARSGTPVSILADAAICPTSPAKRKARPPALVGSSIARVPWMTRRGARLPRDRGVYEVGPCPPRFGRSAGCRRRIGAAYVGSTNRAH